MLAGVQPLPRPVRQSCGGQRRFQTIRQGPGGAEPLPWAEHSQSKLSTRRVRSVTEATLAAECRVTHRDVGSSCALIVYSSGQLPGAVVSKCSKNGLCKLRCSQQEVGSECRRKLQEGRCGGSNAVHAGEYDWVDRRAKLCPPLLQASVRAHQWDIEALQDVGLPM